MLCVIGCGNSNRSDDGAGVFVAQALQRHLARNPTERARAFDAGTSGVEVMFQARGADRLIVVDASTSGSEAGAIFKLPGQEFESPSEVRLNLHDFRWQHALAAGRKIFGADFPADVTVFLIEADSVDFGLELSAPVRSAALKVVAEIEALIEAYCHRQAEIQVVRGSFYLSRELCEAYLPETEAVALIARDGAVWIVPLARTSAGGLLLKRRNLRGDRVIHAQEFIREKGLPEHFEPRSARVRWDPDRAALSIEGLFDKP